MLGGDTTVIVAVLLVAPAPDSFDDIAPVVFAWAPALIPPTLTPKAHVPPAASVASERPPAPRPRRCSNRSTSTRSRQSVWRRNEQTRRQAIGEGDTRQRNGIARRICDGETQRSRAIQSNAR